MMDGWASLRDAVKEKVETMASLPTSATKKVGVGKIRLVGKREKKTVIQEAHQRGDQPHQTDPQHQLPLQDRHLVAWDYLNQDISKKTITETICDIALFNDIMKYLTKTYIQSYDYLSKSCLMFYC